MANKSRSKRSPQRPGRSISRNEGSSIRRVQGGRADTGRDRGEGQGRDGRRGSPAPSRGGDGRMGWRDGGELADERRPEERGDRRREAEGPGGGAHWEPARRGGGSWQGGAGRWEGGRGQPDRGERWAEDDFRSRSSSQGRGDRESEPWHGPADRSGEQYRRHDERDDRADWRPSMPPRDLPRPGRAGREDAPYGEENREFRPQDWDPHGWRERDYGRTSRERYTGDYRRAQGYDDGSDRYGPGWHGQSEFRPERDSEDRHADEPGAQGYGASERLGRFGDRGESGRDDDRERFGRHDDDREYFGRSHDTERESRGRGYEGGSGHPGPSHHQERREQGARSRRSNQRGR